MTADKIHVRHSMLFLFNLGKSAAEAKRMIDKAYGEDSVGTSTVREWFEWKFKKGDFDLKDKSRSGRPQEVENDDLEALLEEDPCQTTKKLDEKLGVDHSTIVRRLHVLGKIQKAAKWVPHELTKRNTKNRKIKKK